MNHLSFFSLLLIAAVTAITGDESSSDPLIRQVVSDEQTTTDPLLNAEHHFHFTLFKAKFGRTYATQEEHDYRLTVFKSNLRRAKRHQLLDPTAEHGVTKFSDLTPSEFRRNYLRLKKNLKLPSDANTAPILPTSNLPEEFDWREKGAVTAVKDQIGSTSCESSEPLNMLKSERADLSSKNGELKDQVADLPKELMAAQQKNVKAEKQVVVVGKPQKAGPFGSVKGIRTNPVIHPDDTVNPRLAKILEKIAVKNELIVALANSNVKEMLEVWFTSIKKVGIPNYIVVALDDGIVDFCKENDVPFYKRDPDEGIDSVAKTGSNHAVSGLKFRILREFLQLGYSVLLSDVDIVYLQNPFDHIYRDSDVESMSDGHDNMTAYGYNDVSDDPSMGWARYAHTMRIWAYNSGFFYLRPTLPAIELLDRVAERLSHPSPAWDQAVFNEELFFPSYPGYVGLHASKRTMDRYMFMNSKTLFKQVRKDGNLKKLKPVIVHVNYHPDKLPRMKAVMEFYIDGKQDALEPFPDGSDW